MLSDRKDGAGWERCIATCSMWDCPTKSKRREITRLMCGRSNWARFDDVRRTLRGRHLERSRYARIFEVDDPLMLHHK